MRKKITEWLFVICLGFILATVVREYFFSIYVVQGRSMEPTFEEGNMVVVNKIPRKANAYERFDIVVFHAHDNEDYIKRIIGLPGDRIEYKDNILYVNGKKTEEPFLLMDVTKSASITRNTEDFKLEEVTGEKVVPENQLFVEGDNRMGSFDSRHFGFVKADQLVGEVHLRYWPLKQFETDFIQASK